MDSRKHTWRRCDDVFLKGFPFPRGWGGGTRGWHLADKASEYLLASALVPTLFFLFQAHLAYLVEH